MPAAGAAGGASSHPCLDARLLLLPIDDDASDEAIAPAAAAGRASPSQPSAGAVPAEGCEGVLSPLFTAASERLMLLHGAAAAPLQQPPRAVAPCLRGGEASPSSSSGASSCGLPLSRGCATPLSVASEMPADDGGDDVCSGDGGAGLATAFALTPSVDALCEDGLDAPPACNDDDDAPLLQQPLLALTGLKPLPVTAWSFGAAAAGEIGGLSVLSPRLGGQWTLDGGDTGFRVGAAASASGPNGRALLPVPPPQLLRHGSSLWMPPAAPGHPVPSPIDLQMACSSF